MGAPKHFRSLPTPARRYVVLLWATAAAGVAWALAGTAVVETAWPEAAVFAGAIALGHLVHTPTREHSYVLSGPFVLAAALALPPHQAVVAIALGLLPGEIHTQAAWYTKVFNYALYIGAAMLAATVFRTLSPDGVLRDPNAVPAGLAAAATFTLTNMVAVALAVTFTHRRPLRTLLIATGVIANLAIDGAGLAMAALWQVSPGLLVFGAIPLAAGAYALWIPHLEEELRHDTKTGAYNARYAVDTLHRLVREHLERGQPLAVVMADLDNLRDLNNRYGHLMGDRALHACADILMDEAPPIACVARFGGEEFVVILPGCGADEAARIADRARQRIRVTRVRHEHVNENAGITVSFGVAALAWSDSSATELLHRADEALYEAKHSGRDRVVVSPSRPMAPAPALQAQTISAEG